MFEKSVDEEFGNAVAFFTGPKEHMPHLRGDPELDIISGFGAKLPGKLLSGGSPTVRLAGDEQGRRKGLIDMLEDVDLGILIFFGQREGSRQ